MQSVNSINDNNQQTYFASELKTATTIIHLILLRLELGLAFGKRSGPIALRIQNAQHTKFIADTATNAGNAQIRANSVISRCPLASFPGSAHAQEPGNEARYACAKIHYDCCMYAV